MSAPSATPTLAPARRRRGMPGVLRSPATRLIGRRLLAAIPVLWGVTLLTFIVVEALPGSAAQQLLGPNATPEQVAQLEQQLGTNRPMLERYVDWLGNVVTGDLGSSLSDQRSVTSVIGSALGVSAELVLLALIVSLALTVPVALLAARKPGGIVDRISMAVSMTGLSIANYVLALVLVWVFAVQLAVLPAIGWVPPGESIGQNLRSLVLPAVSIGFPLFCFYTRLLRADILEQMQSQDYVTTAKAKGVGPWRVLVHHAFRNSLFGLLTIVGLNLGTLIGATVIIEQIFALPGVGRELLQAISNRNIPVIEGIVLVFAVVVVVANLITDLLYAVLDPRIRHGNT
jgi:peptide/nickel transport system permease protein